MSLQWTQAFAVGIPEIDEQHQELFRRVDGLLEALDRKDNGEAVRMLSFLDEYVVAHFRAEERFMLANGYPGYASHKAEHERFAEGLAELHREHESSGASAELVSRVHHAVGDWLRSHIQVTDMAMARFVRRARPG
jgi:hemerythrin